MRFFSSSIGKKVVMAITGLLLIGFLVSHMAGNLLFFVGKDAYNMYGHNLTQFRPLYYTIEVLLTAVFLGHLINSIGVSIQSRKAKNIPYQVKASLGRRSWASSHMFLSGSIVFIFLIVHIVSFRFGKAELYSIGQTHGVRDLYTIVLEAFRYEWKYAGVPFYTVFYIVAVILLGFHIRHGFQSVFKTFGVYHKNYTHTLDLFSSTLSVLITGGFLSVPIYFGLIQGGMS